MTNLGQNTIRFLTLQEDLNYEKCMEGSAISFPVVASTERKLKAKNEKVIFVDVST